jgi:hypothetical protein
VKPCVVVIRPRWVGDFADDLDSIVAAAREAAPSVKITLDLPTPTKPGRYGVTGQSILEVVLPAVGGYAFSKIADAVIAKARSTWKARHEPKAWPRTHIVKILGPDGETVREVKVSDDPPDAPPILDHEPEP